MTLNTPPANWMEGDWAAAVIPIKRMTAIAASLCLQQGHIAWLWQCDSAQIHGSGLTVTGLTAEKQNVPVIDLRQVTHVGQFGDLVVRNTGHIRNRRSIDCGIGFKV